MLEIFVTQEFEKCFQHLPLSVQKKAIKQEKLFRENPFYPSLNAEKLEPKGKQTWSFRIDNDYRTLFRFINCNQVLFLVCGHHNWIYRYKF